MFKYFLVVIWVVLIGCYSKQGNETIDPDKSTPNIVLIMTDDQGWGDLGYHGNPYVQTPVIDKLASVSTRLTNFYVSPVCAPTRASLMTGRYSIRTGIYDTYNGGAIMATEEMTIAEYLKEAGYTTGVFGKWHLGDDYPSRPIDQGFDNSLVHRSGGMAQVGDITTWFERDSAYFNPIVLENGKHVQKNGYCSDIWTDAALEFIGQNKEQPFFVYLSYNAPHTPLQLPEKYYLKYEELEFNIQDFPESKRPYPKMSEKNKEDARKVYGMVENIDDNIGRVLGELENHQLRENTLVIFLTDNGPQQPRFNGSFRGLKSSVYEGGIHVPCFVSYPDQFKNQMDIDVPLMHIDVLPTILDICGIENPGHLDGISMRPFLEGKKPAFDERPLFYHWQRGLPEPYRNIAVRKGDYKLIGHTGRNAKIEDFELYNLANDPEELNDLLKSKRSIAKELRNDFDRWYVEVTRNNPHLGQTRIIIGNPRAEAVILNRNDARGEWGIWAQDDIYGYWDVEIERAGKYDINCKMTYTPEKDGTLIFRYGHQQQTFDVSSPSNIISLKDVELPEGIFQFSAKYQENGWPRKSLFPFYIEIINQGKK